MCVPLRKSVRQFSQEYASASVVPDGWRPSGISEPQRRPWHRMSQPPPPSSTLTPVRGRVAPPRRCPLHQLFCPSKVEGQ
eukprot:2082621-Lingulodinium_polyedra.AAC.1